MDLYRAVPQDSESLVHFFKQHPVRGILDYKIDRLQDFFLPYKMQSNDYQTYLLKDENAEIHASASFVFRDTLFEGEITRVAFASDLRVSSNRKAILEWSNHFLPVMRKVMEENKVSQLFSVINLTEPTAMNTFVRPRNMKRPIPRYYLYRRFNLISVHGKFPGAMPPLKGLTVERGSKQNEDALVSYLMKRSQYRPFTSVWSYESFKNKLKLIPDFDLSNFLVAFDSNKNVVGCLSSWSPIKIQHLIPLSYSLRAHNFRQFLKFFRIFGMTRTLTKPVASTGKENPLKYRILAHLHCNNEDVFESLLWTAYDQAAKDEFLVYTQVEQDFKLLPPQNWISSTIPHALYVVVPPESEMPTFLHPSYNLNPEIEAWFI